MSSRFGAVQPPSSTNPRGVNAMGPRNTQKQKGTAVISIDELDRIRRQVIQTKADSYETMRNGQRADLQATSKGRVKNWSNTMEAQRVKREEDRITRLEDAEIERRRLDAEEQDYQDELRRQQIEKANKTMHEGQDMVKALKGKMLMCDVAYEQQAQQAMQQRKKQIGKDIESHWVEVEKQKMVEYDEKMRAKLEQEYKLKQANAKDISEQLESFKLNFIKQLKEEMLEGELIKRQTEEDLEREKQREIARQQKVAQMRSDLADANSQLMKIKEAERRKEIEEVKKIEAFAQKRETLENMKKEREEKRFSDKQHTRQRMIDRQIEELRALKDNQEEVLNRQVAEAEDRANRLYEQQEQRKAEMKAAIERSRQLQIQRKQAQKSAAVAEDRDFAQFWKVRNEELQLAEEQEREEERQRARELANFQNGQADLKNQHAVREFQEAQANALKTQALVDQQEKNFYSYAESAIATWQAEGKNVKPLIMELKNYKKRVQ